MSFSDKNTGLGKITKHHGLDGHVFVPHLRNQSWESSTRFTQLLLNPCGHCPICSLEPRELKVTAMSWLPRGWKIKFEGFESYDLAKALLKHELALPAQPKNSSQDLTIQTLVGCSVFEEEKFIGHLKGIELLQPSCPDRWYISHTKGEWVVPAVSHFIKKVDPQNKKVFLQNLTELAISE